MAVLWLLALPAGAQQPEPASLTNEYTLKAVFLYNFGRYVQWPGNAPATTNLRDHPADGARPAGPFVIGILGADPFGGALDEIAAKKTIHERPIVVRRFASVEEYGEPCHILFVSRSVTRDEQAALIKKTEGKAVWLVGESPGFAERGGMANFFLDGDRVRFEINADNARRAQLRMDAKLLNLGKRVGSPAAEKSPQRAASDRGPAPE